MLLDHMLQAKKLNESISEIVKIRNEEIEEKMQWQYYLHRIFDKSFNDFLASMKAESKPNEPETYDDAYVEATKQKAKSVLAKFKRL